MAVTLTPQNKQTVKRLLKTGRWNNQSEVFRAALHLLERSVADDLKGSLAPMTDEQLGRSLDKMTARERAEDRQMARASMRHRPTRKDFE